MTKANRIVVAKERGWMQITVSPIDSTFSSAVLGTSLGGAEEKNCLPSVPYARYSATLS